MTKLYAFGDSETGLTVSVNDVPIMLMKRGGEPGRFTSPDRLGFSILFDCLGEAAALRHGKDFQEEIVSLCEAGEILSNEEIQEWNAGKCWLGASLQAVGLIPNGTETPAIGGPPLFSALLVRLKIKKREAELSLKH